MGAWGCDIFENDAAADLEIAWERLLKEHDPVEATIQIRRPDNSGYDQFEHDPTLIYPLAALQIDADALDATVAQEALDHIDNKTQLESWNSPEMRQEYLLKLKEKIIDYQMQKEINALDPQRRPLPEAPVEILY